MTEEDYVYRSEKLVRTSLKRNKVHACPICLTDDIAQSSLRAESAFFGRAQWLLTPIRTCMRHGFELMEFPRVSGVRMHDFVGTVRPSLPRLPELIRNGRFRDPSRLEFYLASRLEGVSQRPAPFLDRTEFHAAARICEMLGVVLLFGTHVNIDTLTSNDRFRAGNMGFTVAEPGEASIRDALTQIRRNYRGSQLNRAGPQAVFGRFYQWLALSTGAQHPAYDEIRNLLRELILDSFSISPGTELLGKPLRERRLHCLRTASNETGIGSRQLKRILAFLGVDLPTEDDPTAPPRLFDAIANADTLRILAELMPEEKAREYLGATTGAMHLLRHNAIVKPFVPKSIDFKISQNLYARSDLDAFLARLSTVPIANETDAPGEDLHTAAKRAYCSQIDIVKLLLAQKLSRVRRRPDIHGLSSLILDADEIRGLVRRRTLEDPTMTRARKELRTTDRVVKALIHEGIFSTRTTTSPVNGRSVGIIPKAELDQFKADHCTIFDLMRETGVNFRLIKRELDVRQIAPLLSSDRFWTDFYRRSDITDIVFK